MLMGISDLIPGVSGGTIALITGIYDDFIHALNNIKLKNTIKLLKGNFLTNLTYFKFDILLTIVLGIISSIIIFSQIISNAIDTHPTKVFSFFFGLILASIPYIVKGISLFKIKNFVLFVASIILTTVILNLGYFENENNTIFYIFLSGFICSCAMILPGISGAYILLILNSYDFILQKLNNFLSSFEFDDFKWILIFIIGIITGVLTFSKFVKFLLHKFKEGTIVCLTGLIIGSLPKLYPHKIEDFRTVFLMENLTDYIFMIIGLLFVILLNRFFKKNEAK
ncbi:MAG: DUF368 domain-containing protein [Flavobacteriaceae bacterium]|nr:DUF368 domain-containing protein [Flavobacteriaceae bacterium]|tara:strand:- start:12671 stop:13516 length:846 start_codon:yes stop_codon:yes gene_type:complete